jgi:hypothetical protein
MGTCVSTQLAESLDLKLLDPVTLSSFLGEKEVNVCLIDIEFPDGTIIRNIKSMIIEMKSDFDIIIGMNIIRLGNFSLVNDNGNTVMTFSLPSSNKPVDSMKPE